MAASSMEMQHLPGSAHVPWFRRRLACFDTETTGPDPMTARLVQAAFCFVGAGEDTAKSAWLAKVDVEIPAEATAIHGITTERANAEGSSPVDVLVALRRSIAEAKAQGLPLVICNAPFDLTLLARELERYDLGPLPALPPIIDPLVLDKAVDRYRKGSRKLVDLCARYEARIDGAHDATHDALAAARVAFRIAQRYREIGEASLDTLQELQRGWYAEQARGLDDYWRRKGDARRVDNFSWPVRELPPPPDGLVP